MKAKGKIRPRMLKLQNGGIFEFKHNDWTDVVVNRKEFDKLTTEIVRVTKHNTGLLTHVYVMRSVANKVNPKEYDSMVEENHVVFADNLDAVIKAAITKCGLKKITSIEL